MQSRARWCRGASAATGSATARCARRSTPSPSGERRAHLRSGANRRHVRQATSSVENGPSWEGCRVTSKLGSRTDRSKVMAAKAPAIPARSCWIPFDVRKASASFADIMRGRSGRDRTTGLGRGCVLAFFSLCACDVRSDGSTRWSEEAGAGGSLPSSQGGSSPGNSGTGGAGTGASQTSGSGGSSSGSGGVMMNGSGGELATAGMAAAGTVLFAHPGKRI